MKKRLPFIFLVVWVLPFILGAYIWFITEIVDGKCIMWYNLRTNTHRILSLIQGMLIFSFIPSIIIIVLYTRMAFAIKFDFKSDNVKTNSRLSKTQINIFQTCIIMVVVFLISWTYYMGTILEFAVKNGNPATLATDTFYFSEVLLEFNSCINPFIYAIRFVRHFSIVVVVAVNINYSNIVYIVAVDINDSLNQIAMEINKQNFILLILQISLY